MRWCFSIRFIESKYFRNSGYVSMYELLPIIENLSASVHNFSKVKFSKFIVVNYFGKTFNELICFLLKGAKTPHFDGCKMPLFFFIKKVLDIPVILTPHSGDIDPSLEMVQRT